MSDVKRVETASFRVYVQKDGRYVAYGSVERTGDSLPLRTVEGSPETTVAQALAAVLEQTGVLA